MSQGRIEELRFEWNPHYVHKGKLRVGNSLADALKFMGDPKETVVGKKNEFKDGVLYRDIDGRKGYDYYQRSDHNLRLWFQHDTVGSIYLTRSDFGKRYERPNAIREFGEAKDIEALRKGKPWIKETTTLDSQGLLKDKTDYPFVDDPTVLGTWKVVDFVQEKSQFVPGKQRWPEKLDFLKGMRFDKGGAMAMKFGDSDWRKAGSRWTKGMVLYDRHGDNTAAEYEIVRADGKSYLFFQWKSGDYIIRYQKPRYYVLQKEE